MLFWFRSCNLDFLVHCVDFAQLVSLAGDEYSFAPGSLGPTRSGQDLCSRWRFTHETCMEFLELWRGQGVLQCLGRDHLDEVFQQNRVLQIHVQSQISLFKILYIPKDPNYNFFSSQRDFFERPRPVLMFGLCGCYSLFLCILAFICATYCDQIHCLYLIGW